MALFSVIKWPCFQLTKTSRTYIVRSWSRRLRFEALNCFLRISLEDYRLPTPLTHGCLRRRSQISLP